MNDRRGFTLLELLVALAIVALLSGLTLAGIQKVRASAAKLHCSNNQHQIAIALQNYHAQHTALPAGLSRMATSGIQSVTWHARLLPYLEHDPLWKRTVFAYEQTPIPFFAPHDGFSTAIRIFGCPSDPRVSIAQTTHQQLMPALTSYLGNSGTDHTKTDGIFYRNSKVRLTDILDGSSQTLAFGERPPSSDFWYGWWYASGSTSPSGSGDVLLGVRELRWTLAPFADFCPVGPYPFSDGNTQQQCDLFHFWSPHSGGANFAFADGSVRFLRYSANDVMPALATRAGGETATVPE